MSPHAPESRAARFETFPPLARYTDFRRPVYLLLGLPFDAIDMATAVDQVSTAARSGRRFLLSTPNLNWLVTCQQDEAFRNSVLQSELSLPDGMPVVWLARLLGLPLRQRVPGSDLFQRLRARPLAVHFFGGPPGFAGQACENLNRSGDPMRCRGHLSPGFGSVEEMSDPATLDAINASGADFLVVALGARKGQAWILRNLDRLQIPVVSHLGAVVNFVAGTVARAPGLVGKLGLEWLWRIKEEPGLWRRYWQDGIGFLRYLLLHGLPALILSRQTPSRPAALEVIPDPEDHLHLRLSGFWNEAGLKPLREALTELNTRPRALRLDLAGVSHLDSAALGLLALLRGHQLTHHQPLAFVGASPALRRRLAHFGAGYLLEPLDPAERL